MKYKYLYTINYPEYEEGLCRLEIEALFNKQTNEKYLLSNIKVNPSRSPYIKERVDISYAEQDIYKLIDKIRNKQLFYNNYKVLFLKVGKYDVSYKERMDYVKEIGMNIQGNVELHKPDVQLALIRLNDYWLFGEYVRNDFQWHIHDSKPNNYSNSLGTRIARALINIAVNNDLQKKVVDPCCGIGTIVIEGLSMNIDIVGSDINKSVVLNAKRNIEFFGYNKERIKCMDMHEIEEKYDVSIVDLPYGLFTPTTLEQQTKIIETSRKISKKAIIVTFDKMDNLIINKGFFIEDTCKITKGNFHRNIYICK